MRFVYAIASLVLSGVLLLLGIGQTTLFAGPKQIEYAIDLDATTGPAVITADTLSAVPGQANVSVTGVEPFVATAQQRDILAWVAPFEHSELVLDENSSSLTAESIAPNAEAAESYAALIKAKEGEALSPPSPLGSDLWLEQSVAPSAEETEASASSTTAEESDAEAAPQVVDLPVSLESGQAVLITSGAEAGDDVSISAEIVWVQDRRTPWAGPLLAGGALFAVLGGVLYLLAIDRDRRGLGPQRGRRGPLLGIRNIFGGKKRASKSDAKGKSLRVVGTGAALVTAVALSGCSASYWPDFSSQEAAEVAQTTPADTVNEVAPVPVTEAQISRVVDDIAEISGKADDELNAAGLSARFTGDALVERKANYKIRKQVSDYDVVPPRITNEALGYQLVQSTEGWPRTLFVVVASEPGESTSEDEETQSADGESTSDESNSESAESPSLALLLTQENPFENYQVSRTIALRGGITMPAAAAASEGTALMPNDLQSLALAPIEVGSAYAKALVSGPTDEDEAVFDLADDSLIAQVGEQWVKKVSEDEENIAFTVKAKQVDEEVVSLSTGTGGALVMTTVIETRTIKPKTSSYQLKIPKVFKALGDDSGMEEKQTSNLAHQLLFYVPNATSGEKIALLGYTSDLVSASGS